MATATIAAWVASLQPSDIPASAQHAARRTLYNWLGCAIHGAAHPAVRKAHDALAPLFGPARASLLGTPGHAADAQHAALLNGMASHVHDFDDTHLATIIHPAAPVAAAALAYAEHAAADGAAVSGPEFMAALVAGVEVACKAGLAVWPAHYDVGWHITSTAGALGAAAAVARLMRLDAGATVHALGLAATQVVGLRDMFGSDAKSFHPGRAAQAGLLAALLARQGFTGSEGALEARRGWTAVVCTGQAHQLDRYAGELGRVWEVESNAFKPFPCGIVCHPAIDAAIQLRARLAGAGHGLEGLQFRARVHPLVIELTAKATPRDGLEAKFSVFHGVAVGLLYGKAGPAQYADEVVRDAGVVAVRERVSASAADDVRPDEAVLSAVVGDGNVAAEVHVEHAVGSLAVPMTDEQLTAKFEEQVGLALGGADRAKRTGRAAWGMLEAADVAEQMGRLYA